MFISRSIRSIRPIRGSRLSTLPSASPRSLSTLPPPSSSTSSSPSPSPTASPASPSRATSTAKPTHHLITLHRSPNGLPKSIALTLSTLGLHKMHQSALYPFSPALAGKILAVKELVKVRNVTREEGEMLVAASRNRGEGLGLEVMGRAYGGRGGV